LVADLESWMREQRAKLSRGNDLAKAMDYMLKRWTAFTRFNGRGLRREAYTACPAACCWRRFGRVPFS
jgi:hypothetical protein